MERSRGSIAGRLGNVTSAIRTIVGEDMTQLVEIASAVAKGDGCDEAAVLAQSYNAFFARLAHPREIGCKNGQGYYFSKPVDAVAATALIADWQPAAPRAVAGISGEVR